MPFVPAPNVAMCELRQILDQEQIENILYFEAAAALTPAMMTQLGLDLIEWWNTDLSANLSIELTLSEVFITDLTTNTSPTVSVTTGLPDVGQVANPALPGNVALAVSFRTAGRGRSSRGRNFVPGIHESAVSGSHTTGSFRTAIEDSYQNLIGAGALSLGFQWAVVSRITGGAPRTAALVQPVTSAVVIDNVVDSQRRRLPGRGS